MSPPDSATARRKVRRACPERCRRDGWTAERQLRFLDALARTRSVTRAAAFAGMSRESAHRLRARPAAALFALLWDRAMQPPLRDFERHTGAIGDGALMRAMATHFRRERGDFDRIGSTRTETREC